MKILFHLGAPCDPPTVNGVVFEEFAEDKRLFVGEVPDDMAFAFEGVPQFSEDPAALVSTEPPRTDEPVDSSKDEQEGEKEPESQKEDEKEPEGGDTDTGTDSNEGAGDDEKADEKTDDLEALKAEVAALEAKKAAGETTSPENMKLGKLKKKLEAALSTK